MRKNTKKVIGFTLCLGLLTGCAQTPESSLVKQKGSKSLDTYKEAEVTTAARTTIRDLINAPATCKSQVTDDSAKLVVNTDATVEIPDVEKISAISVTPAEITQDLLDRITDAFFFDAKLYTAESYYTQTKSDIQATIDKLKEYVANGNLDPYNLGTDSNGDYEYNIYDDIEYWEGEYASAPETKTLVEGRPVAGTRVYSDTGDTIGNNDFTGVAQMSDGSAYYYRTTSYGGYPLEVKISRITDKGGKKLPDDHIWLEYTSSCQYEKPTEESIGITLDDAKKLVQEKVDKMGISDLNFCGWDYAIQTTITDSGDSSYLDSGYALYYSRTINKVPLTYTMEAGGALEDMDSTMESWAYENLYFYVDADGISSMCYSNPYNIGETKTENLSLLPF